jgi:predicted nucleic-acid-binding Zn-ribbon protein
MALMRKCTKCGAVDSRNAWDSPADAAKDEAFDGQWTCTTCAWTEFDLVETETERAGQPETVVSR